MRYLLSLGLLAGLLLSGCAPAPTATVTTGDVQLDGVSILGAWGAIGAPDQADVDSDLRRGVLTRTLVFNPYGRVTLMGHDRREGTGSVSFEGRVRGGQVTFDELPGTAQVALRNSRTMVFTDPRGNRTIYRRQ